MLQYNLTQEEKERYKNGQPVDLTGKIKSYSINNFSIAGKGSTYSYWDGCMEYIYETNPCTTGYNHAYGDGTCEVLGTPQAAQPASLIAAIDHCAEGSTGGGGGFGGGIGGGGSTGGGSTGGGGSSGGGTGGSTNPDAYNTFIFFSFDDMFNICPDGDAGCQAETQLNIQVQQYLLSLPPHVSSLASYNGVLFTIKDYFRTMGYGDDVLTQNLTHIATWFNAQNNTDPTVKLNNFKFAKFALNFLINNPDVSWEQFQNWFIGTPEGMDGEYVNPDLIEYETPVVQQSLPTLSQWYANFPKIEQNGFWKEMKAPQVYQLVGGSLYTSHLNDTTGAYQNACAIRGSRALLYSGIIIPVIKKGNLQLTQKGGDGKNYILAATSFLKFMKDKFGDTPNKLEGADANDATKVANFLKGKNGIYVIENADPRPSNQGGAGYSGHVDAIVDGICISGAYTQPKGGVKSIRVWILN
ncbi:type VI secretion system amidase effector protein Tae4 [uncultured Chryseobacterium sp.]|uniref:type VI secretion system amidase effector protein Tae4 n=1 Tax=uncultured Chryseobacterium sp. TaxID=259322 RepID=UPI00263597B7|nr:type VI secretion system amidase effector protein Tae4 [uncultured Chryseobacterium sp.]